MASNSSDDYFSFKRYQDVTPGFINNTTFNNSPISTSGPRTESNDCSHAPMQPLQRCPRSACYTVERFTDSAVNMTYNTPTSQVGKGADDQEIEDTTMDDEQSGDEGIDNEGDDHGDSPLLSDVFGPLTFSNGVTYHPPRNLSHRSSPSGPMLQLPGGEPTDWTRGRHRSCKERSFFANDGEEASNSEDCRSRYMKQAIQVKSGSDINSSLTEMFKTRDFDSMFTSSDVEGENNLKLFEAEEDDKMEANLNFHKGEIDILVERPFITSMFIEDLPEVQDARKQPRIDFPRVIPVEALSAVITAIPRATEDRGASREKKGDGGWLKKTLSRRIPFLAKWTNNADNTNGEGSEEYQGGQQHQQTKDNRQTNEHQQTEERRNGANSRKGFSGLLRKSFNR